MKKKTHIVVSILLFPAIAFAWVIGWALNWNERPKSKSKKPTVTACFTVPSKTTLREKLDECFAIRGELCNIDELDEDELGRVQAHFDKCRRCQEWALKHNLVLRVKKRFAEPRKEQKP